VTATAAIGGRPWISAVVCTHNRAAVLPGALRSLANQTLAVTNYEIVVVDNDSSDATRSVVHDELSARANFRYVREPRLGLSRARNTGWREASAPIVAFLDDDAIASRDWLENILGAFETVNPRPGGVGGRIDPIWEAPRPSWLPDYCLPFLIVHDLSPVPIRLPAGKFLIGTNMAFPRSLLEAIGGFPVELGPIGGRFGSGEETMVQRWIRAQGHMLHYDPAIRVRHLVPESRLSRRWLLRRLYWEGLSRASQRLFDEEPNLRERLRLIAVAFHKLTSSPRRLLALASPSQVPETFERKASTCRRLGFLVGMFTLPRRIRGVR
jgi:glycosyltransferase involved in cell wall biosynthesis